MSGDRLPSLHRVHHLDLYLPPEGGQVGLLRQVELPAAVLKLGHVIRTLETMVQNEFERVGMKS